jgi:WhiB family transcriptional regulator, redox-sensing transcriptional regulator
VTATAALGSREAAVLEHLAAHPGLTATELARVFGLAAEPYKQLAALQQKALVTGVPVWHRDQGRSVVHWAPAPPGTVPPCLAPDPAELRRRRKRDTAAQRARRARRNPPRQPSGRGAPALAGAACKGADIDLFFGPDAEFVSARKQREAEAKAICARCPARDACLAYALDASEPYGVWGGLNEAERRAILRQRRAS